MHDISNNGDVYIAWCSTVEPLMKDSLKEDKPGQSKSAVAYTHTLYKITSDLSTKDKRLGPELVYVWRFHCY